MSTPLRAAVIGVGSMGRNHARIYASMDGVELVAVSDADEQVAGRVGAMYRCNAYADFHEMLDRERLDLVSVVVPTRLHYAVAAEVIERGVSLLIEKPIAATPDEGRALIEAARRASVVLTVGHVERFNPAVIALKEQIADGELGRVFQIAARRVGPFPARIMDVGVGIDLATHDLDILNFLIGSPVTRMHVELHRYVHQSHEDMISAVMRFQSGVIGTLDINWLTPTKIRELSVIGERGMYVANYLTQDLTFFENDSCHGGQWPELSLVGVTEGRSIRQKVQRREPLFEELRSFADSVRTGRVPRVTGEDGVAALELANQLMRSGLASRLSEDEPLLERAVGHGPLAAPLPAERPVAA